MEGADLVRLEGTDDGMQESSVMEQDEVLLLPIVWVHELFFRDMERHEGPSLPDMQICPAYLWRNGRTLHLVEQRADLCEFLDVCTIWV